MNKDAFLQKPDIANLKPRFEDWNLIKAQALITGKVSFINEGGDSTGKLESSLDYGMSLQVKK